MLIGRLEAMLGDVGDEGPAPVGQWDGGVQQRECCLTSGGQQRSREFLGGGAGPSTCPGWMKHRTRQTYQVEGWEEFGEWVGMSSAQATAADAELRMAQLKARFPEPQLPRCRPASRRGRGGALRQGCGPVR
ncbi:hypothetical protein [Streptomyces sp. NPDC055006]